MAEDIVKAAIRAAKRKPPPDTFCGACGGRTNNFMKEPYVATANDAEERLARGERQEYCETCRRYYWP